MPDFGGGAPSGLATFTYPFKITPEYDWWLGAWVANKVPTSGARSVVNRIIYVPFAVHSTITIKRIGWVNGGTVAGNVEVGIYDSNFNRLVTSGAIAQATINVPQYADITDTELTPGNYWIAFVSSNNTMTVFGLSPSGWAGISAGNRNTLTGIFAEASASLPATGTPIAATGTQDDDIPYLILDRYGS